MELDNEKGLPITPTGLQDFMRRLNKALWCVSLSRQDVSDNLLDCFVRC